MRISDSSSDVCSSDLPGLRPRDARKVSSVAALTIFPAIDLKGGQVVRLAEGDMARATVYGDDPAAQAMLFADAGSQFLHVVDLDGSFAGRAENQEAVEAIIEAFPAHVQLGGGSRTAVAVAGWFGTGVAGGGGRAVGKGKRGK